MSNTLKHPMHPMSAELLAPWWQIISLLQVPFLRWCSKIHASNASTLLFPNFKRFTVINIANGPPRHHVCSWLLELYFYWILLPPCAYRSTPQQQNYDIKITTSISRMVRLAITSVRGYWNSTFIGFLVQYSSTTKLRHFLQLWFDFVKIQKIRVYLVLVDALVWLPPSNGSVIKLWKLWKDGPIFDASSWTVVGSELQNMGWIPLEYVELEREGLYVWLLLGLSYLARHPSRV